MVCPSCYQDYISKCSTSLTINAGLTPDTDYTARITDKFLNSYWVDFTTDGDGLGVLDLSELPEAFFNPAAGWFKLEVIDELNEDQTFTINETDYTCIEFEVRGGDFEKTYLGEFTEEAASS